MWSDVGCFSAPGWGHLMSALCAVAFVTHHDNQVSAAGATLHLSVVSDSALPPSSLSQGLAHGKLYPLPSSCQH